MIGFVNTTPPGEICSAVGTAAESSLLRVDRKDLGLRELSRELD